MNSKDTFNTPILFLIFNRPDLTRMVFGRIGEVRPKYLFIAGDGPREEHPEDKVKCEEARNIVLNNIDWDCEIQTLFRDENLGCGLAVSQAITWFFEHVEEGIIMEDDCYPSLQFYNFTELMLNKFRENDSIMHISGGCYLPNKYFTQHSYYFTKYPFSWGWATWKSSWQKFNYEISRDVQYPEDMRSDEINYWNDIKEKINNGWLDTWAWRWNFSIWEAKGKCLSSTKNLIRNLGFVYATHTLKEPFHYRKIKFHEQVQKVFDNPKIEIDRKGDRKVFERFNLNKVSILDKLGF